MALACLLFTAASSISLSMNSWYLLLGPMLMVLLVAFIWPLVTDLPAPTRSTFIIGFAGMMTLFSFLEAEWSVYLLLIIGFAFIGTFVIQMTRPQPRERLVQSVAFTVTGVFLAICTAAWVLGATIPQTYYLLSLLSVTWAWCGIQIAELLVPRLSVVWRSLTNVVIGVIFGALGAAFMVVIIPGVSVIFHSLLSNVLIGVAFGLVPAVIQPLIRVIFGSSIGAVPLPSSEAAAEDALLSDSESGQEDSEASAQTPADSLGADDVFAGFDDEDEEDEDDDEDDEDDDDKEMVMMRLSVTPVVTFAILGIVNFVFILVDSRVAG